MGIVFSTLALLGSAIVHTALGALGFSAGGPVAGTWAASWMSSAAAAGGGGVAAGSAYACVQSLAMGGATLGASALAGIGAGVATLIGAAAWGVAKCMSWLGHMSRGRGRGRGR